MENELTVVVCTRENGDKIQKFVEHVKDTCGCALKIMVMVNPDGIGLTQIYNQVLDKEEMRDSIIAFIHDDIEFLRKNWGQELLRLFNEHEEYGIIGVAGASEFDENGAWWNYKQRYGQVLHRKDGKSWLTAFSPLLKEDLEEVCVIDGLFMGVHTGRISQHFDDKNFGMQFYDIDFCLANYFDKSTKIGVTTNIRLAHNSVGELKPEWYTSRQLMGEKYKDKLPVKLKK